MPLFAVHALDKPGALPLRLEHYAEHRAFIEADLAHNVSILTSGPLQSDDGSTMTGSLFIIEAEDRATVERFVAGDPFHVHGVWGDVKITRFHRRKG